MDRTTWWSSEGVRYSKRGNYVISVINPKRPAPAAAYPSTEKPWVAAAAANVTPTTNAALKLLQEEMYLLDPNKFNYSFLETEEF